MISFCEHVVKEVIEPHTKNLHETKQFSDWNTEPQVRLIGSISGS